APAVEQVRLAQQSACADDAEVLLAVAVEVADPRNACAQVVVGGRAGEGGVGPGGAAESGGEPGPGDSDVIDVPPFELVKLSVGDELELEADRAAGVGAEIERGVGPAGGGVGQETGDRDVAAADRDAI